MIEIKQLNNSEKKELYDIIKKNQNEIKELKEKLARYPFELLPGEKMMVVHFKSLNQDLTFSCLCKNTDIFINIELKLYKEYPNYSEKENYFTVGGIRVNKYKTLEFNNIKNNDIILLIPLNSSYLK